MGANAKKNADVKPLLKREAKASTYAARNK